MKLEVLAYGTRNLGPRAERLPQEAEVRINGQVVGSTPFRDALPVGDYLIEVDVAHRPTRSRIVRLRPRRGGMRLTETMEIALTPEQTEARAAWRAERLRRHADTVSAEQERLMRAREAKVARSQRQLQKWHQERVQAWSAEAEAVRARRTPTQTLGIVATVAGGVLVATGTVLEVMAANNASKAEDAFAAWQVEADAQRRAALAQRVHDRSAERDWQHAAGLTTLLTGSVGLLAGVTLLATLPEVPQRPRTPKGVAIRPSFRPSMGGVELSGAF